MKATRSFRLALALVALGLVALTGSTTQASNAATTTTSLSDLTWTSAVNGWGPVEKNRSNGDKGATDGRTITLDGQTYAKGLGTHASSDIRYQLGGAWSTFTAKVGVDDEVGTRGSVTFQVYVDGVLAFDSGVMTGSSATKSVDVSVAGKNQLRLVVTTGGDNDWFDHADWADATLTGTGATTPTPEPTPTPTSPSSSASDAYLSDLAWSAATNGWGPAERDRSNGDRPAGDGRTMILNGEPFVKGIGAHSASDIRYQLGGAWSTFAAKVGVDDEVGSRGSVVFQVYGDGQKLYDSGVMNGSSATKSVSVSVAGKNELRLVVTYAGDNTGYDHADWADARLSGSSGQAPQPSTSSPSQPSSTPSSTTISWSAFNQPLGASAALDPNSSRIISALTDPAVYGRNPGVSISGYTVPVYYADASTPRYDVRLGGAGADWNNGLTLKNVPIPAGVVKSPGGDGHVVIIDRANAAEYDFWLWENQGPRTAGTGIALKLGGSGFNRGGLTAVASGSALTAGLILPEEIAAGEIRHALQMAVPGAIRGKTVPAATDGGAGWTGDNHLLHIGARLRLSPSYNIEANISDPGLRAVARAARDYGIFIRDGGGAYFYAQDTVSGADYPWSGGVVSLPKSFMENLQVLSQGTPYLPSLYRNGPDTWSGSPVQ